VVLPACIHTSINNLHLAAAYACADVAHPVIVSDFAVLIMRSVIARLRGKEHRFFLFYFRSANQCAAS